MIVDIEDYFTKGCGRCDRFATTSCSALVWADGLAALRQMCRLADLQETVKWGHPCYMYAGRNIVILGAFRDHYRLSFFNAALMQDPARILEKQGPNTQAADTISFRDVSGAKRMEPVILAYLEEAKSYADAGKTPPKDDSALVLPAELLEALNADPILSEAFYKLTRGRRKSYIINLNAAKKAETRIKRIAAFRDKIIAGKGATER